MFAELNRQLDARALMLQAGTPIDAAAARPPQREVSTGKASDSTTRREALVAAGIAGGHPTRPPLASWQRWRNAALPLNGGLVRNGAHRHTLGEAMNLRSAERLVA